MKNTKFIAGALVLSMGLLGTGYAYWTDALQVESTVSTGNLDVILIEGTASAADSEYVDAGAVTIKEDGKSADLTISNMYPGAVAEYTIKAQNKGSIGATISSVDVKDNGSALNGVLKFTASIKDAEGNVTTTEKANGVADLDIKIDQLLAGEQLDTEEVAEITVIVEMDSNAGNEYQNESMNVTMQVNWAQFNQ